MVRRKQLLRTTGLVLGVLILMALIVYLTGRSFGFFQYAKKGDVVNIVSIKGVRTNILNDSDENLNLQGVYPVYDSEGLRGEPFEFEIINETSKAIDITLKIENDSEKQAACKVEGINDPCTELPTQYIKFAYKLDDGNYSEPKILGGSNGNRILADTLTAGSTTKVSLLLWIDKDAPNSIQGNVFFGSVIISGEKNIPIVALVPFMTDETHPSGEAFANSFYTGYQPRHAFSSSTEGWVAAANSSDNYIGYDFESVVTIKRIMLKISNYSQKTPIKTFDTSIKLQSSNDRSTWTDIKTINVSDMELSFEPQYFDVSEANSGRYYRLYGDWNTSGHGTKIQFYGY